MPPVDLPVEVLNLWACGHIQLGGDREADQKIQLGLYCISHLFWQYLGRHLSYLIWPAATLKHIQVSSRKLMDRWLKLREHELP